MAKVTRWLWISTPRFTVRAELDEFGCVKSTAALTRWMCGIHIDELKIRLQKRWDKQLQFKIFEDKMIDVDKEIKKEKTEEEYRTLLFEAYEKMSLEVIELRAVIQNKMKYSITQKDKWVKQVTELGQQMRKLNSKTLHYIEDNIK